MILTMKCQNILNTYYDSVLRLHHITRFFIFGILYSRLVWAHYDVARTKILCDIILVLIIAST